MILQGISSVSYSLKVLPPRWVTASASLVIPLLAACSFNMNQNPLMEKVVQTVPLDNGKTLSLGYKPPDDAVGCQLVNESSRNWAMAEAVGGIKAGGGRQVLQEEAVESVKQRPQDGINYVAFMIPDQTMVGVVNVTMARDATTSYYRCVNPPQPQ
jgi:hypothetical protein